MSKPLDPFPFKDPATNSRRIWGHSFGADDNYWNWEFSPRPEFEQDRSKYDE